MLRNRGADVLRLFAESKLSLHACKNVGSAIKIQRSNSIIKLSNGLRLTPKNKSVPSDGL